MKKLIKITTCDGFSDIGIIEEEIQLKVKPELTKVQRNDRIIIYSLLDEVKIINHFLIGLYCDKLSISTNKSLFVINKNYIGVSFIRPLY
jgi:hypothetical protein